MSKQILVPDIGDFENVEIIEILVKQGDEIKINDPLITLESDKSSVEVPSTEEGIIDKLNVKVGDKVSKGDIILFVNSESKNKKIIREMKTKTSNQTRGKKFIKFCRNTILLNLLYLEIY